MLQLTSTLVGSMPANALKVLVVLMLERVACTKGYLMTVTDMSDKTMAKAIDQLLLRGLATHNGGHLYQIASGVEQLPLMADALPEPEPENVIDLVPVEKSRNISDFSDNACMYESNSQEFNDESPTYMVGRKNSELDAALLDAGFFGDGLERLRKQAGLTARVVRYHVANAPSLGAALARIERGWKVPASWEPDGLEAGSERKKRYGGGGRYAGIVQT